MCPSHYYTYAYGAQQATDYEDHYGRYTYESGQEVEIPCRWITVWLSAITSLVLGLGGIIHWLS